MIRPFAFAALLSLGLATVLVAGAQELTVQTLDIELKPSVERFMKARPGVKVDLRVVSYQSLLESLPVQLASGHGPDVSAVTDFAGLSRWYLDLKPYVDAPAFEREFGPVLKMLRPPGSPRDAIYGISGSMTLNGAYVNLTLFRQAGVPVPKEGATWDDWAAAARRVARATRTEVAMEMDRSGQRFASLAISYGARLVDEQGRPVVDDGLKNAIRAFVGWHRDGTMPMDLWGAVGGATHRDNFADFMNGKVVFYFGGSWTLKKMDKAVGELFDWAIVDAPCGPSSCTVLPGGGAMVAFRHTRQPKLAADFISFLARESEMRDNIGRTMSIPVAASLVRTGVQYPLASERVRRALAAYVRQVPKIPPAAYAFSSWRYQRAAMNAMTTRISQVLTRELDVDRAAAFIKKDVDLAIEAAQQ